MSKETENRWNKDCQVLVGKTIKAVSYMTDKEMKQMGWDNKPLVIEFTDGTLIFASQDDEGNGAGALFTNIKKLPTIPVIWGR